VLVLGIDLGLAVAKDEVTLDNLHLTLPLAVDRVVDEEVALRKRGVSKKGPTFSRSVRPANSHHVVSVEERIVNADDLNLGVGSSDASNEAANATEAVDTDLDLARHQVI